MPAFNSEKFIEDAITSVVAQEYQNWELLICDDNSNDRTIEICKRWEAVESRIMLVKNKYGKGASGARNSCLDKSSGRFVAFLDSDDLWYPDKLKLQLDFMRKNGFSFTFTYYKAINEDGVLVSHYSAPKVVGSTKILFSNFIPCLTVIYDVKKIGKILQPDIERRNDYALWLKILCSGTTERAHCFERVTALYRANTYGLSSGKKLELLGFYRRCIEEYGSVSKFTSFWLSICYIAIILIKKVSPFMYNNFVARL
jgi:teichuronic acid biosynthesis glycosyltransferase TuaG